MGKKKVAEKPDVAAKEKAVESVPKTGTKKAKIVSVVAEKMATFGINEAEVFVKGVGSGRDSALRSFINRGLNVVNIKDKTPIPHNGPRPPKVRRI